MSRRKTILITGTSSGIGMAMAEMYLSEGHQVIGLSRRDNLVLSKHPNFRFYQVDLSNPKDIEHVLMALSPSAMQIDMILLNAGILGEIQRMETAILDAVKVLMQVNVWANKQIIDFFVGKQFPLQQVVAISSGASKNGSAGWGAYSISKAALNSLIQTYAAENPQIHFSAIAPGLVDTAMQAYISTLNNGDEFPVITRLQASRGTAQMPSPKELAPKLDQLFQQVLANDESGIYKDIRAL